MATAEVLADWCSPDRPWTVSELTIRIKDLLEGTFAQVWICGEISDISRPQSGHIYFALKDEQTQIRAVVWRSCAARLGFDLEDGQQVICFGHIDVYPPRGSYQLIVQRVEPVGVGLWHIRLRQLRERLAREGLFDPSRKRPLPRFPRLVGVITSPTGAAIHDFLEVVQARWNGTHILVFPVRVQGEEAVADVVAALRLAHRLRQRPDVLVITRGGGSTEDLWCFNDETLVRAVHASEIPVVSAIGHEIDVTLCDLAADVRALTPTEAAQRVVPSAAELLQSLASVENRMRQGLLLRLKHARQLVDQLARRPVLAQPFDWLFAYTSEVDDLNDRLRRCMEQSLERCRQRASHLSARLDALSPLATLSRGYSVTLSQDGRPVRSAGEVRLGELIETILVEGRLFSRVERKSDGSPK